MDLPYSGIVKSEGHKRLQPWSFPALFIWCSCYWQLSLSFAVLPCVFLPISSAFPFHFPWLGWGVFWSQLPASRCKVKAQLNRVAGEYLFCHSGSIDAERPCTPLCFFTFPFFSLFYAFWRYFLYPIHRSAFYFYFIYFDFRFRRCKICIWNAYAFFLPFCTLLHRVQAFHSLSFLGYSSLRARAPFFLLYFCIYAS